MSRQPSDMELLVNGTDRFYEDLEERARHGLIVYRDQELPPGASPPRSPIGVEIAGDSGEAILRVNPVTGYRGRADEVRIFLERGERRFTSFGELRAFLQHNLADAYARDGGESGGLLRPLHRSPGEITDLAEVECVLDEAPSVAGVDAEELFAIFTEQVRGQEPALRIVAETVARHVAKVDPRRPATLFALGPTGVGKTRTAEVLATVLSDGDSGEPYGYLRLDMNQYQEPHRVSELLGAPQGYIGYGHGAELVDRLSATPRLVVLFDEIEKAHPSMFQILMNAIDAGRLTRAAATGGDRLVDCRRAIFVFTSNIDALGALTALTEADALHDPTAVNRECARALLYAGAPHEIVGRIQAFLPFTTLDDSARAAVMTLAIQRIALEYGLTIERVESSVLLELLAQSEDARFGARTHEHLVERVLGHAFGVPRTASERRLAYTLAGPPFELVATDVADEA